MNNANKGPVLAIYSIDIQYYSRRIILKSYMIIVSFEKAFLSCKSRNKWVLNNRPEETRRLFFN
jgi:hypothetical protein